MLAIMDLVEEHDGKYLIREALVQDTSLENLQEFCLVIIMYTKSAKCSLSGILSRIGGEVHRKRHRKIQRLYPKSFQ